MSDDVIFGVDITKGTPDSRKHPKYAVCILSDETVEHHRLVSRQKLMQLIRQYRPDIVAMDNIYELIASQRELNSLMAKFPHETKLVQVTGEHKESLVNIAKEHDLKFDRFDPLQEAYVCAVVAGRGVGVVVSAFYDKTIIKVSRARSPGRGGWSQNRYRRKIHGAVKQKVREIEDILRRVGKEKDFTYELNVKESFGGYSKGEFVVDTHRKNISISTGKFGDVQVRIHAMERDQILFTPLEPEKRAHTIVGIDPGTTVGIAILDLNGQILKLHSSRTMSQSDIIELIAEHGSPVVIASDVVPMPATVERIGRAFNAVLASEEMSSDEKIRLAKPYGYANNHERDALSAALMYYKNVKNKFLSIARKAPLWADIDTIKAEVLRGESVAKAIQSVTHIAPESHIVAPPVHAQSIQKSAAKPSESEVAGDTAEALEYAQELIESLQEKVKDQKKIIKLQHDYIEEMEVDLLKNEEEISDLNWCIKQLGNEDSIQAHVRKEVKIKDGNIRRLEKIVTDKNNKIERLEKLAKQLKSIRKMEVSGRVVPVKILDSFTRVDISRTHQKFRIKKGDVLYIKDASGGGVNAAEMIAELEVRAIIIGVADTPAALSEKEGIEEGKKIGVAAEMSHTASNHLLLRGIPVLTTSDVPVRIFDDIGTVLPAKLDEAIDRWKVFMEDIRRQRKVEEIQSLVNEYRQERIKELRE